MNVCDSSLQKRSKGAVIKRTLIKTVILTVLAVILITSQALSAFEFEKSLSKADIKWIQNLLDKNPGLIHTRFRSGDSLLHMAIRYCPYDNVEKIVDYILSRGADVNAQNDDGTTPLIVAVSRSLGGTASLLISKGADVNKAGDFRWTPLHSASSTDMAELLLNSGADINARLANGRTALFRAVCLPGEHDLAFFLISKGADLSIRDKENNTLLHMVLWHPDSGLPGLLISKGIDAGSPNAFGEAALHYAARFARNEKIFAQLFQEKLDPNVKDKEGLTPLHWAAEKDNRVAAESLVRHGASFSAKDNRGRTPLFYAELSDGTGVSTLLKSMGVNSNDSIDAAALRRATCAVDNRDARKLEKIITSNPRLLEERNLFRETLLHLASYAGNKEALGILISHGADLNAVDTYGLTPLHNAVNGDQDEAVELLCRSGASVSIKDDSGDTPLKLARKRQNATAFKILLRHGAKE